MTRAQCLNSVLIEGTISHRAQGERLQDGRLILTLHSDGSEFPVAFKPGRLADLMEQVDSGRSVRLVGRLIGWPLITGAMIEAEHVELRPSAVARALARADLNGAD